jgi:proline iminopeptidase
VSLEREYLGYLRATTNTNTLLETMGRFRLLSSLHYFLLVLNSVHHGHSLSAVPRSRGTASARSSRGSSVVRHPSLAAPSSETSVVLHRRRRLSSSFAASATAATATQHDGDTNLKEGSILVARSDGSSHRLSYRIARPMSLSSRLAAPIVVLHGGPSVPSSYLYPLVDAVPYRSIVFHDQLGCGMSDEPTDVSLYSIEDSVEDLKALLKHLGVWRFHLYGQSYGGILAFEYLKNIVMRDDGEGHGEEKSDDDAPVCLSAILSSAPTDVKEVESEFARLIQELASSSSNDATEEVDLEELFRRNHQCRLPEMPSVIRDAYANAGSVWRGTSSISDYVAEPPPEGAARMPPTMIMRGEYDFVSEASVSGWRDAFNTKSLRYKTLKGCSHHGLSEDGTLYGEIVNSFLGEYD